MSLRTRGHSPRIDNAVAAYSKLGEHAACWLVLGAAGSIFDRSSARRTRWRRGAAVVAGSYVLNQAVKFTVRRHRPELPGLPALTPTVTQLSFPSAHATTSFAAAHAYCGLVPGAALYAVAVLLALSRPFLGVHYPSDVLAGAALGTAASVAATR